jgi:hypothetical protein
MQQYNKIKDSKSRKTMRPLKALSYVILHMHRPLRKISKQRILRSDLTTNSSYLKLNSVVLREYVNNTYM